MRVQKALQPLISIVIAFMPQNSVEELLAPLSAGLPELMSVGDKSHVETSTGGGAYHHYLT